jgi:hypothetical protein
MLLLSQYSSQHCSVFTYILAAVELSSSIIIDNRHRPLCPYSCPQLLLFLVHDYIPLAHNLNNSYIVKLHNQLHKRTKKFYCMPYTLTR